MRIRLFIEPSMNEQQKYNYEMFRDIPMMRTERIHAIMAAVDTLISETRNEDTAEQMLQRFKEITNENKN